MVSKHLKDFEFTMVSYFLRAMKVTMVSKHLKDFEWTRDSLDNGIGAPSSLRGSDPAGEDGRRGCYNGIGAPSRLREFRRGETASFFRARHPQ